MGSVLGVRRWLAASLASIYLMPVVAPAVTTKNTSRLCQMSLVVVGTAGSGAVKLPLVENHCFRGKRPRISLG